MLRVKEKLDAAMAKNYLPSQNEVLKMRPEDKKMLGKSEANIQGRKQGMELTHTLPKPEGSEQMVGGGSMGPEPVPQPAKEEGDRQIWADELRAADERTSKFRDQVEKLEKVISEHQQTVDGLRKQVEARDYEIKRLQGLFEGGQNLDALATKYLNDNTELTVTRLNNHIDFLNKENHRLENELKKCKPEDKAAFASLEASLSTKTNQLAKKNEQLSIAVKELEKAVGSLNSEKTMLSNKLEALMSESEAKIKTEQQKSFDLEQKLQILENQMGGVQKEAESSAYIKAAYTSDKKAYNTAMESLKNEKNSLIKQNKELIDEIQKLKQQLEDSRNEVNVYKGRFANASREIEMSMAGVSRANNEAKESSEECVALRKQLHELEAELLTVKGEKANLKFDVDRLIKQKYSLEEQLAAFKGDVMKKKSEMESTGAVASRFETLYNSARSELEYLKRDNSQLEQLLTQQKIKVTELDKQVKEYFIELSAAQANIKTLQQEQKILSDELAAKTMDLRKAEGARMEAERKLADMKGLESQISSITNQAQKQMQETLKAENEKGSLQSMIAHLQTELNNAKTIISERDDKIRNLSADIARLQSQIKILEDENVLFRAKADKAKTAEQDLQLHKNTLELMQKKDVNVAQQLEEARLKLHRAEAECDGNRKKAEIANKRAEGFENEVKKRSDEILSLKMKIAENERLSKVEEEQKKDLLTQINDAQKNLMSEHKEREKLELDIRNLSKDLEASRAKEVVLNEKINQLKTLVENLDSTNNELIEHVKNTTSGKKSEETEKMALIQQVEHLKGELSMKEGELTALKNNMQQLDSTMDKLQTELDAKTEENEKFKIENAKMSKELEMLRSKVSTGLSKEDTFNKRVIDRENEIRELKGKLADLSKELEDTKEMLFYKNKEVEDLNNDMQAVTKENQYVNNELIRLSQSQNNLKQVAEELSAKERDAHQTLRATEMEREDLIKSYKSVVDTNERQRTDLEILTSDNKEMHARIQEMEQEIQGRGLQIQRMMENEQKHLAEINTLERQVSQLAQELEDAKLVINQSEVAKNAMMNEADNARQLSFTLEAHKDDMQRDIAFLEEAKNKAEIRLATAEQQIELLKLQIEQEKAKNTDLELMLAKERGTQHELQLTIQQLESEKNNLKGDIGKLNARINGIFHANS